MVFCPIAINYSLNGIIGSHANTPDIVTSLIYVPIISLILSFIAIYADKKLIEQLASLSLTQPTVSQIIKNKEAPTLTLSNQIKCLCC